jgi:hypothetical protein
MYSFPNIIRQIKSRRTRWAGHMARMGEDRKVYEVLAGKPKEKFPLERPRRSWEVGLRVQSGFSWLRIGPVAGSCKYGDETAGSGATELVTVVR